jgi:hypothetical protein
MRDLRTDPRPKPVLHRLELRRLTHNGRPVNRGHRWKAVAILAPKGGKDRRLVRQPAGLADDFHGQDVTLGQGGRWPAVAQAVPSEDGLHPLVHQTHPRDLELIPVHGAASFELLNVLARRRAAHGPGSFSRKTRTPGHVKQFLHARPSSKIRPHDLGSRHRIWRTVTGTPSVWRSTTQGNRRPSPGGAALSCRGGHWHLAPPRSLVGGCAAGRSSCTEGARTVSAWQQRATEITGDRRPAGRVTRRAAGLGGARAAAQCVPARTGEEMLPAGRSPCGCPTVQGRLGSTRLAE